MKRCPFCAEKIQDAAIVCRYCGRDLPQRTGTPDWEGEARRLAEAGRKIDAIKLIREHTHQSLSDAKALTESWTPVHVPGGPQPPQAKKSAGCGSLAALGILAVTSCMLTGFCFRSRSGEPARTESLSEYALERAVTGAARSACNARARAMVPGSGTPLEHPFVSRTGPYQFALKASLLVPRGDRPNQNRALGYTCNIRVLDEHTDPIKIEIIGVQVEP